MAVVALAEELNHPVETVRVGGSARREKGITLADEGFHIFLPDADSGINVHVCLSRLIDSGQQLKKNESSKAISDALVKAKSNVSITANDGVLPRLQLVWSIVPEHRHARKTKLSGQGRAVFAPSVNATNSQYLDKWKTDTMSN